MTTILWNENSGTHEWTDATQWQGGVVPGSGDTAKLTGTSHVSIAQIDTAITVHEIIMNALHSTIDETSAGSITATELDFLSGTMVLDAVNTFTDVHIGAFTQIGVDGALGKRTVVDQVGMIEATANLDLRNAITMEDLGFLSAAAGVTETVLGAITYNALAPAEGQIFFGSTDALYGDNNATGTVELGGTSFTLNDTFGLIVEIMGGTVKSGSGQHALEANEMFSDAKQITIDHRGVLDVGHVGSDVTLTGLTGSGELASSGNVTQIHLSGANFSGSLGAATKITAEDSDTLSGNLGNTAITMAAGADLDLSHATGKFTLSAPSGAATLTLGTGTVNHFTDFQDGHLTIDTSFTDTDLVVYKSGAGYTQMVIHPGHGAATTSLYFYGLTDTAAIVVDGDANDHMVITYNTSAEAHARSHDAAVAGAAAEASFVPMGHELF